MYVCMYIGGMAISLCMYVYMFIQMNVSIFTMLESIKVCMYVSVCIVRIKKNVYVCILINLCAYIHTYIHTYVHTYINKYICNTNIILLVADFVLVRYIAGRRQSLYG